MAATASCRCRIWSPEKASLGRCVPGGELVSGVHLEADETAALDAASDPAPAEYPCGGPGYEQRRLISGGR